ncbi:MAG TPA: hypothetical protein VMV81_02140, partial [Phycisphaerae bacterium]|nr:hypothetical protein [Phycisphaerae bacterium]
MSTMPATLTASAPGLGLLIRLKLRVLRNRIHQLIDQSPLTVALAIFFVALIWFGLYAVFEN